MSAIACESVFHLHFAVNLASGTSHKDQIVEKETCCFLFHVRINRSIQIHNSGEMLHCDESHHPETYRQELLVRMLLSMQDAGQLTPPWQASHHMKHPLYLLFHYCSKHFLPTSQRCRRYPCFHQ